MASDEFRLVIALQFKQYESRYWFRFQNSEYMKNSKQEWTSEYKVEINIEQTGTGAKDSVATLVGGQNDRTLSISPVLEFLNMFL